MAERRATNKWYPPDYDPRLGSLNRLQGQHPLRERARKLDQGVLVVRFELPHDAVCEACGAFVGQGTRFNADKQRDGAYLSSAIWTFSFPCPSCHVTCRVRTNPATGSYDYLCGLKRRSKDGHAPDTDADALRNEQDGILTLHVRDGTESAPDTMAVLEQRAEDKARADAQAERLTQLEALSARSLDDYATSRVARAALRARKAGDLELEAQAMLSPIAEPLVPATREDEAAVARVAFPSASAARERARLDDDVFAGSRRYARRTSTTSSSSSTSQRVGSAASRSLHRRIARHIDRTGAG